MINLLPPEVKSDINYARKNTALLKWIIALLSIGIGIFVVLLIGQLFMNQSKKSLASQIEDNNAKLKVQKLEETQAKIKSISDSVKLSTQVLSKQILFSEVLKQIGAAIPGGARLTDFSLNKLEGGIDLSFVATDYNTATQIQVNLESAENKLFEKADILNVCGNITNKPITTPSTPQSIIDAKYPCGITIRAKFVKDNPFSKAGNQQ